MSTATADERAHTMFDEDFDTEDCSDYWEHISEEDAVKADLTDAYLDRKDAGRQGLRYRDW